MRTPKLVARGVNRVFRRAGDEINVLNGVNLDIYDREFVVVVGPSGCGKTTLLNIMAGFDKPTSGSVLIDGKEVTGPDRRRIVVFQEHGVFPWLTVEANIGFGLDGLTPAARAERVAYYVKLVGLEGFEHAYPHEVSGGMKQRVEVARALAVQPDMLFLDEPFGALDFITRHVMRSEILRIWSAEQKTVMFITHDIEESVQLADRIVVMSARPAMIRCVIENDLPRPRDLSSPRYIEIRDQVLRELGLAKTV
ncbi:MAG: ABC transporter ATP-binding protein [Deltaproteobacteria bacterium]|nr:ABC transporter ATP-binding protein [Deltaproteobacteria bacterium]